MQTLHVRLQENAVVRVRAMAAARRLSTGTVIRQIVDQALDLEALLSPAQIALADARDQMIDQVKQEMQRFGSAADERIRQIEEVMTRNTQVIAELIESLLLQPASSRVEVASRPTGTNPFAK